MKFARGPFELQKETIIIATASPERCGQTLSESHKFGRTVDLCEKSRPGLRNLWTEEGKMLFLDTSHHKLFKNKTNEVQIEECRESPQAIHEVNATKKPSLALFVPPKDGSSPRVIGNLFEEGTEERPCSKERPTDNLSDAAHSRLNRSEDGTSTIAARKFYSRDVMIFEIWCQLGVQLSQ